MVINRKYEWKPVAEKGEADRLRRDLQSFAQTGFKQVLETGGRSVGRGAKEFAARLPGVEIAQELLRTAMTSAVVAIPRQLESLRGLARLLPSTIRPPVYAPKPESDGFSELTVQESLPLEVVEAPLVSEESSEPEPSSPFELEQTASPSDIALEVETEEKQCRFEFYESQIPKSASDDATIEIDSEERGESSIQTTRFAQDPPRTRFVARRLASQGYAEVALSIYEQLLSQDPDDQTLVQEADEIRNGQPLFENAVELPKKLPSASCIGLMDRENRITSSASNRDELTITWSVGPKGVQRAQSVLGKPGELYLRIFEVCSDPDAVVRSTIIEHGPVLESGSWTVRDLSNESRRAVAIGLRAEQRFATITHVAFAES